MTREEALQIIDRCKGWNYGQKSVSLAFNGERTPEDDVLDARREALRAAWFRLSLTEDKNGAETDTHRARGAA